MDDELRQLERARIRMGAGCYDHLMGHMVFVHGARKNWRGMLARVDYGSVTRLVLSSLWEIDISNANAVSEEEQIPSVTPEHPAVIPEGTYQLVLKAPW